jgi:hypothetical protein
VDLLHTCILGSNCSIFNLNYKSKIRPILAPNIQSVHEESHANDHEEYNIRQAQKIIIEKYFDPL